MLAHTLVNIQRREVGEEAELSRHCTETERSHCVQLRYQRTRALNAAYAKRGDLRTCGDIRGADTSLLAKLERNNREQARDTLTRKNALCCAVIASAITTPNASITPSSAFD